MNRSCSLFKSSSYFLRTFSSSVYKFDPSILQYLACPLYKTPLYYDETNQQLIATFSPSKLAQANSAENTPNEISNYDDQDGDEIIQVAYPIRNGNMKVDNICSCLLFRNNSSFTNKRLLLLFSGYRDSNINSYRSSNTQWKLVMIE